MALITCPECQASVSDHAPACVHCGFPLTSTPQVKAALPANPPPGRDALLTKPAGAFLQVIGLFLVLGGLIAWGSSSEAAVSLFFIVALAFLYLGRETKHH
jgi:hypothetical protein